MFPYYDRVYCTDNLLRYFRAGRPLQAIMGSLQVNLSVPRMQPPHREGD
jgi:hypothetical protein